MTEAHALLDGLMYEHESRLSTERAGWKYPVSREFMAIAHLYDLHVAINTDPKHKGDTEGYPMPFSKESEHTGKKMTIEAAEKLYALPIQTKTDEEVLEANRIYIANKKAKESQEVGTSSEDTNKS